MADIVFVNNASSLLAASINNLDTVVQVSSGDGALFPVFTAPEFFVATLEDDAGNIEVVQCTGRLGDLLTVVRGFDNSVAQSFDLITTRVELRLTAVVVEEFLQRSGDTMSGDLDMNQNNLVDAKLTGPDTQMLAGEIVGVPLRGDPAASVNEVAVPSGGGRATAGGAEIRVAGDDVTGDVASATETSEGVAELADQTEMDAGTDDARIVTPKKFAETAADDTIFGTIRTADQAAVEAGSSTDRAVTPESFALAAAAEGQIGTIAIADQATVDAGLDDTQAVTPAKLAAAGAGALSTFSGTSNITGLTIGKKYLVSGYGYHMPIPGGIPGYVDPTRVRGNGLELVGGFRVGEGAAEGQGITIFNTGSTTINYPDGEAQVGYSAVIIATTTDINVSTDFLGTTQYYPCISCFAVQLD